jgi:hypothetical protein
LLCYNLFIEHGQMLGIARFGGFKAGVQSALHSIREK